MSNKICKQTLLSILHPPIVPDFLGNRAVSRLHERALQQWNREWQEPLADRVPGFRGGYPLANQQFAMENVFF